MVSVSWFDESRAYLWDGDADEALRIARKGMETTPGTWLSYFLVFSLLAQEEFEEADHAIGKYFESNSDVMAITGTKYAAMGNAELALQYIERASFEPDGDWWFKLMNHARLGDLEKANEVATRMDTHPFGAQALASVMTWCLCGAPFGLEAAPNFAANLKEAGFDWPPPSPIKWPLKDW